MAVWETEDEMATAAQASLPTPTDTPYRTPSRASRRSARRKSISPAPSSSPPPLPHGESGVNRNSKDVSTDETISILDPRRFTPTLHASLVSEILALRRDQEEKTKTIENLESNLHSSRGEYESLAATLSVNSKETRSLKRQLALLEGGTSSALGELARERDEAVDSVGELKRRLEVSQRKVRAQEEDSDRVHELWSRDKDTWEDEKRKYERRIHVAEGRMKAVLEEVAAYQAVQRSQHLQQNGDSEAEDVPRENGVGHGSDTASIRSMSMTNSIRLSLLSGPNGYGSGKLNGVSLADELDLDEDDETDHDGRDSVMSTHRRAQSRESMLPKAHDRNRSTDSLRRPGSVVRGRLLAMDKLQCGIMEGDESASEKIEDDQPNPKVSINRSFYVEVGIQYTPPASPVSPVPKATPIPEVISMPEKPAKQLYVGQDVERDIEANQRRKRVHAGPPLIVEPGRNSMVSAASQTLEDPLSPPRTPKSPTPSTPPPPTTPKVETMTSATQTDLPEVVSPIPVPLPIPSISIHPPSSRPATPKVSLLPQHFKDVACQVSIQVSTPCRSVSVQTEEIRVDQRINLLPRYLQPSSISSNPPSPSPSPEPQLPEKGRFSPVSIALPPRNPKRVKSQQSIKDIPSSPPQQISDSHDVYPRSGDDGPLANSKGSLRRPHRSSSLIAAFEGVSSDEADDFADADLSDSDFRTALSAPKPKSSVRVLGKRTSLPPTSVPEGVEPQEEKTRPVKTWRQGNYDSNGIFTLPDAPTLPPLRTSGVLSGHQLDKPLSMVPTSKSGTMRRATLISNGIAAHQGRPRSPSLPETSREPPFPIPTRASSRKPPFSVSAPSEGNRSPTRDNRGKYGRRDSGRGIYRTNSIRKVRSATTIPANTHRYRRHGSRSPPPLSASTEAPESPQLPPMPMNDITSPDLHGMAAFGGAHRQQPSVNTAHTSNTGGNSIGNTQGTSVVDAIAQTMVGEWMFKYVRRKSLGVPENGGIDGETGTSGARHKRWVWLAPYERAVMWSGKQPTSGSALMGKSGRKLTIQSVLDVKDDNPSPKGVGPLFNRSILILTPARALKFTATTRERHYVWLTALSFLAHSSHAVPEIMAVSSPPAVPNFELPRPQARLRKHPAIRDSIRIAKGKAFANASRSVPASVHSSQQGGEPSIRTDTSTRGERASEHSQSAKDFPRYFPEAADPPIVPRFSDRSHPFGHGRKRSNTGSRVPPPLSFRGFSERGPLPVSSGFSTSGGGGAASYSHNNVNGYGGMIGGHSHAPSTAGISIGTNGSSDIYQSQHSGSAAGYGMSVSGRSSIRTSDASARPSAVVGNFFDAVGTVRMEAFISPLGINRFDEFPDEMDEVGYGRQHGREILPKSKESRRRSRHRDSFFGGKGGKDDWYGGSRTAGEEEYGLSFARERDDPFRGF